MKSKLYYLKPFGIIITILSFLIINEIIFGAVALQNKIVHNKLKLDSVNEDKRHLLSRKRRYLEFPVGSSFQLVYDLIVGVVDYTNYLILGVTVALAWELPSKPPSEILDQLKNHLQKGTKNPRQNNRINYIDDDQSSILNAEWLNSNQKWFSKTPPLATYLNYSHQKVNSPVSSFHPPIHYSYYVAPSQENFYRPFIQPQPSPSPSKWHLASSPEWNKQQISTNSKYPWWNISNRFRRNPLRQQHSSYYRRHRIYPVFGKRSIQTKNDEKDQKKVKERRHGIINEELSLWDRLHVQYHRTSRQDLYTRIEKYLNKRGFSGQECVLRALCETEHKSHEKSPGSFVGELMRTLFTLPEPLVDEKPFLYDEAHQDTNSIEDCHHRYSKCPQSLWSTDFIH